jgi:hypothetical protein
MEDKNTKGTEDAILEFFGRAIRVIDGVPSHFVFNMDEIGHQDWEDCGEQICLTPAAHGDDYVDRWVQVCGGVRRFMSKRQATGIDDRTYSNSNVDEVAVKISRLLSRDISKNR